MSDISELFARDPNECSKQDIQAIVAEFRAKHQLFKNTGDMNAGRTKPRTVKKKEPGIALDLTAFKL